MCVHAERNAGLRAESETECSDRAESEVDSLRSDKSERREPERRHGSRQRREVDEHEPADDRARSPSGRGGRKGFCHEEALYFQGHSVLWQQNQFGKQYKQRVCRRSAETEFRARLPNSQGGHTLSARRSQKQEDLKSRSECCSRRLLSGHKH